MRIDRSALLFAGCLLALGCDGGGEADTDAGRPPTPGTDAGEAADGGGVLATDAGPRTDSGAFDAGGREDAGDPPGSDAGSASLTLPPSNGQLDYQLGDAYAPPSGVTVLSRDREASPAPGVYNICYVNGFQTQPHERRFWTSEHRDLLLQDGGGGFVIDPDWDEIILDVTTADKRRRLADIVGGWIDNCADDGFDAVEIDNLDTYSRSGGRVRQDHAVMFMRLLSDRAHARGMAIAQKNSAEILDRRAEMGTDFAVAEECNRWRECSDFTDVYGDQVYVIEYRRGDFDRGCREFPNLSVVLRDLNLRGPRSGSYVYDDC